MCRKDIPRAVRKMWWEMTRPLRVTFDWAVGLGEMSIKWVVMTAVMDVPDLWPIRVQPEQAGNTPFNTYWVWLRAWSDAMTSALAHSHSYIYVGCDYCPPDWQFRPLLWQKLITVSQTTTSLVVTKGNFCLTHGQFRPLLWQKLNTVSQTVSSLLVTKANYCHTDSFVHCCDKS